MMKNRIAELIFCNDRFRIISHYLLHPTVVNHPDFYYHLTAIDDLILPHFAVFCFFRDRVTEYSSCRQSVDSLSSKNGNNQKSSHFCKIEREEGKTIPSSQSPHASRHIAALVCLQSDYSQLFLPGLSRQTTAEYGFSGG